MALLRLDYQRGMQPLPWAGGGVLALALTVLAFAGTHYLELSGKVASWEARAGQAEAKNGQVMTPGQRMAGDSSGGAADVAPEIKHANEVLQQLSLPWGKLFQAIESSSGKDVALLAMEPDAEKHVVKISGEAKNIAAVLEYIKRLSAQEVFSSVYLQSHQIQQQDPEKPVRFALLAAWRVTP